MCVKLCADFSDTSLFFFFRFFFPPPTTPTARVALQGGLLSFPSSAVFVKPLVCSRGCGESKRKEMMSLPAEPCEQQGSRGSDPVRSDQESNYVSNLGSPSQICRLSDCIHVLTLGMAVWIFYFFYFGGGGQHESPIIDTLSKLWFCRPHVGCGRPAVYGSAAASAS